MIRLNNEGTIDSWALQKSAVLVQSLHAKALKIFFIENALSDFLLGNRKKIGVLETLNFRPCPAKMAG
jgi:hypothetical protein